MLIFTDLWWLSALLWVAAVVTIGLRFHFLRRSCASWGYVEREDDLYISHGVWWRSLTAVPYGRMQLVEVESGPLERLFNLASVTLKTASPGTDARIPGLAPRPRRHGCAISSPSWASPTPPGYERNEPVGGTRPAPAPTPEAAARPVKQTERPHLLTPLIRGWVVLLAIVVGFGREFIPDGSGEEPGIIGLGLRLDPLGIVGIVVLAAAAGFTPGTSPAT